MKRRALVLGRRLATIGAVAALVLSLAGDRGRAATVPAPVNGQDPLEVLELKVRPNVIVVLDSSGSMTLAQSAGGGDTESGDHPASKMYQAKQVVQQLVTQNQDKVSFMFGQYTQDPSYLNHYSNVGRNRFQYTTTATPATEITMRRALGDSGDRGLQSWQIIYPEWNTLYFEEFGGGGVCRAVLPGTFPRFYARGSDLAADLQTAMNGASCASARQNTYTVTYSASSGQFTFGRSAGSRSFQLRPNDTPNNIQRALGGLPTGTAGTTSITLNVSSLRRTSSNTRVRLNASPTYPLTIGDSCTISGASPTYFNGTWSVVSITSSTEFFLNGPTGTTSTASSNGTVTCNVFAPIASSSPYTLLYRTTGTGNAGSLASPFRDGMDTRFTIVDTIGTTTTTWYQLAASRLWNGEVIRVNTNGEVCGMDFATAATKTVPPSLTVQLADSSCTATGDSAVFRFAGGQHSSTGSCRGYQNRVDLIPCDLQSPPAPLQITTMMPTLQTELLFNADGSMVEYAEAMDGGWAGTSRPAGTTGGARAAGSTPLGNTLIDLKGQFDILWNVGLATGPWASIPAGQRAIRNHLDPKEKTIVLFVTDGNDTCDTRSSALGETDFNALRAAHKAQQLYERIDALESASSVQTYVIGYGGAFSGGEPTRLNWIAWGGSGLTGIPTTDTGEAQRWDPPGCNISYSQTNNTTCISNYLNPRRALCPTCTDAFVAPDAATLATQLQSIIDQGASEGDFNAQQSITESIFEYVDFAQDSTGAFAFDPDSPSTRYGAIVPTRFVSSFSLPGFKGQLRAFQNDGSGNSIERWNAGSKLWNRVSGAMAGCDTTSVGGSVGVCVFAELHGGATDATIAASTARIKRRIYTTDRNGVYDSNLDPDALIAAAGGSAPANRVTLWPPQGGIAPSDHTTAGTLDEPMGLPPNNPTARPTVPPVAGCDPAAPTLSVDECWFETLKRDFKACLGSNLPSGCTDSNLNTRMRAARREARDIMLAFMAGATTVTDATGIKRTTGSFSGMPAGSMLFQARSWILADSELATAAVVTPPSLSEPEATPFVDEYRLYRDGVRNAAGKNPDTAGLQIRQGFGLTRPDDDQTTSAGAADSRTNLKPVMTVVYAPANDMLHAFRAGPSCSSRTPPACAETGGEELWGFVPYDQLNVVYLRPANEPQGRDNHVYSLARGIRFADVFVPGAMTDKSIGGVVVPSLQGAWRRVLYFGRGIGGKYLTALDVTGPGAYTLQALQTVGPIPLWSRGNPDTEDGIPSGTRNGTAAEWTAYSRMGETWSIPTLAFVNPNNSNPIYRTDRYTNGVNFVLFVGSGYGEAGEGTTHYTLDALSGDVIAAVDVESTAASYGLTRSATDPPYPNALVANSVSFNRSAFAGLSAKVFNVNPHPWSQVSVRVYVGDLHGRLWKFLTDRPDVAIPAADLGADQPVGAAVALLGEGSDPATTVPNIFVSSGADRRAAGPFRSFAFLDNGTDTDTATAGSVLDDGVRTYTPVVKRFARTFDQGTPDAECGYPTEAVFRGTIQPTSALECDAPLTGSKCEGNLLQRVFFGGTRLSLPNTRFAPPTPLSCGTGTYPCRSQFDSIIYALGVVTGQAAYDLNASGDDAYRIFRDSRIAAISVQADPDPGRGGASFVTDEGLMKGTPKPPPPSGVPPTATTATANVVFQREPGQPAPAVRYGSTVCQ